MIRVTYKQWRAVGLAAGLSLAAACGEAGPADGEGGDGGEGGEAGATAPAPSPATATAPAGGEGGEAGEAGAASAYAGVSGDQLTALRLQHLKGFVMAAARVTSEENQPAEAGILVQQGLLEVYDAAPDQFGRLNIETIRAATEANLNRAQMSARLRAAEAEIERVSQGLEVDDAALTARMVDIATGLYQHVNQADFVDPIEYQHSMGAALAARDALIEGQNDLRRENLSAFSQAQAELNRFVGLWRTPTAPEQPASYQQVLAQGSRVRLELSPFL